jgi:hypothetical protein
MRRTGDRAHRRFSVYLLLQRMSLQPWLMVNRNNHCTKQVRRKHIMSEARVLKPNGVVQPPRLVWPPQANRCNGNGGLVAALNSLLSLWISTT